MSPSGWREYLAGFHAANAGITEELLTQTSDGDGDPYRWVAGHVPPDARLLDLACGSGPIHPLHHGPWIGVDLSAGELETARGRGAAPLVLGDGAALPFPSGSFDAVACSMALMVMQPVETALAEIGRVLVRGGRLVVLVPSRTPLHPGDVVRYAELLAALRHRLHYPNDGALADAGALLAAAGLRLVVDERRRFGCRVADARTAALCVASLYLPDEPPERMERAMAVARRWIGHTIGIPLRLLVAER